MECKPSLIDKETMISVPVFGHIRIRGPEPRDTFEILLNEYFR